jgi:hypothetical protein
MAENTRVYRGLNGHGQPDCWLVQTTDGCFKSADPVGPVSFSLYQGTPETPDPNGEHTWSEIELPSAGDAARVLDTFREWRGKRRRGEYPGETG